MHGSGHHHHHHHVDPATGDRGLALAVPVNIGLTLIQLVGGMLAGSLALVADALHNFSDAIALVIAFAARKIARRPADASMTFGYARIETVAALINYTTLIVIGLFLAYEAVLRFFAPEPVAGWYVIVIAGVALVVDLLTALLTFAGSKTSMNIRAAFLHNVADALGSVAVIIAGTLILLFGWTFVDPLVTLLIAGYILYQSFAEIGPVIRLLAQGAPPGFVAPEIVARMANCKGVADVHHAHIWQMDEHHNALEAHVVVAEGAWDEADEIKADLKAMLLDEFNIDHTMLEMECSRHACQSTSIVGDAHAH